MRPKASILEELDKALAYFHPLTLEDFYLPEAGDEPVTRENISEKTAERFIYLYRLNIEYEHWLKLDWEQKLEHAIQNSHWTREGDYAVSRNPLDEEYVKFVIAEHKSMRRSKKYRQRSRAHAIPVLPQQGDVGFERAGPDWLTEKMAADLDEELAHRGLVREGNDEVSRRPITQEFA